jgi:hypothetical protein
MRSSAAKPPPNFVKDRDALRGRMRRLLKLDKSAEDNSELGREIIPLLRRLGSASLIGGAIRDVARAGVRAFSSDLDFVVRGSPREIFHKSMRSYDATPNKFGGFSLAFETWKVDVWHIEDTWAKTSGHVDIQRTRDLLQCTFFDWDSALFDIETEHLIYDPGYLDRLRRGVMEMQLEANPNPTGALVRGLRRAALWNVCFGERLSEFCERQIAVTDWNKIVELDQSAFDNAVLKYMNREEIIRNLKDIKRTQKAIYTHPIRNWKPQAELDFSDVDSHALGPN